MTYDADAGSSAGHFYVNGIDTGIVGSAFGAMKTVSNPVYIGIAGHGSESSCGHIDNARASGARASRPAT